MQVRRSLQRNEIMKTIRHSPAFIWTVRLLVVLMLGLGSVGTTAATSAPADETSAYFLGRDGTAIVVNGGSSPTDHTCNAGVFSQVPGQIDFFVGRARDYAPPGSGLKCEHLPAGAVQQWLALYRMDWRSHTLSYVHDVLKPPLLIAGPDGRPVSIRNAYDPSVVAYNGELWMAFECGGQGFRGVSRGFRGVSVCVGPLDRKSYTINDATRVTVLVEGGSAGDGYRYSASAPNLIVLQGRVYLYWAALQGDPVSNQWLADAIRGMALAQEPSGLRRIWGLGAIGRAVPSFDPNVNVQVAGPNPADPMSDQSIDLKGAYATDNDVYLLAGLGGRGPEGRQNCVSGGGGSYGCFRLQMFRSSTPLGPDIFNRHPLISPKLPLNPSSYARFYVDDRGQLSILASFFPPHGDYNTPYLVPSGMWSFPINLSTLRY